MEILTEPRRVITSATPELQIRYRDGSDADNGLVRVFLDQGATVELLATVGPPAESDPVWTTVEPTYPYNSRLVPYFDVSAFRYYRLRFTLPNR